MAPKSSLSRVSGGRLWWWAFKVLLFVVVFLTALTLFPQVASAAEVGGGFSERTLANGVELYAMLRK